MLFIFVDVDNKFFRYTWQFIYICDENVKATLRFIIVFRRDFCPRNITNDEPKFFAVCGAGFNTAID